MQSTIDEFMPSWDNMELKLKGSMEYKIKSLMACIKYNGNNCWVVEPVKNYNKHVHTVSNNGGVWSCTCQGYADKLRKLESGDLDIEPSCSHIISVKRYAGERMKERYLNNKQLGE